MMRTMRRFAPLALLLVLTGCFHRYNLNETDDSDSGIQARITAALRARKDLDLRSVTIDVHSRIVTISGLVGSYQERDTLLRTINSLSGIDQVVPNVIVSE